MMTQPRRMAHLGWTLPLLSLTGAALTACGDNLLGDDVPPPEIKAVQVFKLAAGDSVLVDGSDAVLEGDTLIIHVEATATRVVETVEITTSGALASTLSADVPDPTQDVEVHAQLVVPSGTGPDSVLSFAVKAIDSADKVSDVDRSASVVVQDGTLPTVSASASPTTIGPGDPVRVDLTASDARGLAIVGAILRHENGWVDTVADTLAAGTRTYQNGLFVTAPVDLPVGAMTAVGFALDIHGLASVSDSVAVSLTDDTGPQILTLSTDQPTYPLGDSVLVSAHIQDPTGIRSVSFVGTAVRGDTLFGTDSTLVRFPAQTVNYPRTNSDTLYKELRLQRWLTSPDKTTREHVRITVMAEDSLGNVSVRDTSVVLGGPAVDITFPADDTVYWEVDDTVSIKVKVKDSRPILRAFLQVVTGSADTVTYDLPAFTPSDTVQSVAVPLPAQPGTMTMQAHAINADDDPGQSATRVVQVVAVGATPTDTIPPVVSLYADATGNTVDDRMRVERTDSVKLKVAASDAGAGIGRIGLKMIAKRKQGTTELRTTITMDTTFPATHDEKELDFSVPMDSLYGLIAGMFKTIYTRASARLDSISPDTLDLEIFAFAVDSAGTPACSVGLHESRPCLQSGDPATTFYTPVGSPGYTLALTLVRGRTVELEHPTATIADLAVDTVDERLFMSNISDNLVEVVQLEPEPADISFLKSVQVGSQPWGVFIGERVVSANDAAFRGSAAPPVGSRARTLIVANSGGTNMSLVHLDPVPDNIEEVDVVRLGTPNTLIYDIQENYDDAGRPHYKGEFYDFSDRPQFVAQDSLLRLVYSTVPTDAANTSTVRYGVTDPDPTAAGDSIEVRLLLNSDMVDVGSTSSNISVANVDSLHIYPFSNSSDLIELFSHAPGYPGQVLSSGALPEIDSARVSLENQIYTIMTARGDAQEAALYYPFVVRGKWNFDKLGMSDTTFVTASGDRGTIAIGEGARSPTGRIILWFAGGCNPLTVNCAALSDEAQIEDLVSNASERVLGVGLNQNGTLGVARGQNSTYFFTPDLRLQGLFQQEQAGGAGAAFHPDHNSLDAGGHHDATGSGAAFTGSPDHSVEVVNTFHFNLINRLAIRDNIVGPLKVGPPLDTDNGGLGGLCATHYADGSLAQLHCVVAKVYGITDTGGVVVINVRRRDLEPYAAP